jgi:hypothetical protein
VIGELIMKYGLPLMIKVQNHLMDPKNAHGEICG